MTNGKTNIDRLATAGVLDPIFLTDEGRQRINEMKFSDEEIAILKDFKTKLGLRPLEIEDPTLVGPFKGGGGL